MTLSRDLAVYRVINPSHRTAKYVGFSANGDNYSKILVVYENMQK